MRFHHSTRRRANRQGPGSAAGSSSGASGRGHQASRWAQLSYCRMTNIHFNRRLQIEPPPELARQTELRLDTELEGTRSTNLWPIGGDCNQETTNAAAAAATTTTRQKLESELERLKLDGEQVVGGGFGRADADQATQFAAHQAEQRGSRLMGEEEQLKSGLTASGANERHQSGKSVAANSYAPPSASNGASNEPKPQANELHEKPPSKGCDNLDELAAHNKQEQFKAKQQPPGNKHHDAKAAKQKGRELDIESAREKLIAQVEKHPFWSNKAAKRMRLLDVCERQVYIYELASYCERRDLEWRYEPFRGMGKASATSTGTPTSVPMGSAPFQLQSPQLTRLHQQGPLTRQQSAGSPSDECASSACSERLLTPPTTTPGGAPGTIESPFFSPSFSQPTSPLGCGRGASFDHDHDQEWWLTTSGGRAALNRFTFGGQTEEAQHRRRRSLIKRSCSSATSSPLHHQNQNQNQYHAAQAHHLPSRALDDSLMPLSVTASCPIERPLPSAHFVWSIEPPEQLRPAPFVPGVHTAELPQSSFVKRCHGCSGRGRLKCNSCYGVGYEVCISCSGRGTTRALGGGSGRGGGALSGSGGRRTPTGGGVELRDSAWGGDSGDSPFHSAGGSRSGRTYDEPGGVTQATSGWQSESCHFCHGAGQKRCWICAGRAYQTCTACAGAGQLRCFLNLNITWLSHRDESVLNNSDNIIPRDRLRLCSGLLLLDQVGFRLSPLESSFSLYAADLCAASSNHQQTSHRQLPHRTGASGSRLATPEVGETTSDSAERPIIDPSNTATTTARPTSTTRTNLSQLIKAAELNQLHAISTKLLEKHEQSYRKQERLLRQRQKITQIECFVVNWEWKRRRGHFVIYGDERKVYIAKYPFKSICNIT